MAEPCTLNIDAAIGLFCSLSYLATNMFAFAIAISPDNQSTRILGLVFDILRNQLFIL